MNKLTKKTKQNINKWAKSLPPVLVPFRGLVEYTGQEIFDGKALYTTGEKDANGEYQYVEKSMNPDEFINALGSSFDKNAKYKIQTIKKKELNHKKEMIKAAKNDGWGGVQEYLKPYLTEEAIEILNK